MGRRGYGSGSIRQIRPDVWEMRVAGRSKTFRGKRKDAERALATMVAATTARAGDGIGSTVDDLLTQWRQTAQLEASTWQTYAIALAHLPATFRARRLTTLTLPDFDRLYAQLARAGLGTPTVRKLHTALSSALTEAVRWQWIGHHPARGARLPSVQPAQVSAPDEQTVLRLLATASGLGPETVVWLRLALGTGARRGEVLALRWSDIDLKRGAVRIRASMNEDRSVKTTKPRRERTVTLDSITVGVLTQWKTRQAERALAAGAPLARDPWVLSRDVQSAVSWRPDGATQRFRRLCATAGITGVRLHDLRHAHATLLLRAGHPVNVVSERLGHARTSTTHDIYGHVLDGDDRAAADTIGRLLG